MLKITVGEILKATQGELLCGESEREINSVSIDSREISHNALFVAIKGENSDGHDYIQKAVENGAVCIISEKDVTADAAVIKVENSIAALGKIAKYYKAKFNLKTIAVTGSVGKTTTKDMLWSVMNTQYYTLKTEGNFNNEIGLPLTALRLNPEYEAAVFEMGMSAFGEIRYLCDIVRPDVGVITNIGMSHIENLGSQEGIFKAKTEICEFFDKDSLLIVNGDDEYLKKALEFKKFPVVSYGIENNCDFRARDIENLGLDGTKFAVDIYGREHRIYVKTPGVHNVYNALAAIACGVHYSVSPDRIKEGIENFTLTKMRMAVEKTGTLTVINDCYNSSPDSLRAALKVLSTQNTRRVAILGDILEMGDYAKDAHLQLGKAVLKNGIDILITAGENAKYIAKGAKDNGFLPENIVTFDTTDALAQKVGQYIRENDSILIKASRGMHFEKIFETITKEI